MDAGFIRYRIRFAKQGDLRWISHRDLLRTLERLFRRAGVALRMSEGFHPKPRINCPSALALGVVGLDEVLEVDLVEDLDPEVLLARLSAATPEGLALVSAEQLPTGAKKARVQSVRMEVPLTEQHAAGAKERVAKFLAAASCPVDRGEEGTAIDVRPLVEELRVEGGVLQMKLRASQEGGVRPRDVLAALGLADLETSGVVMTRTKVELQT